MNIVWTADFNTNDWPQGGAELTDKGLIQKGKELGYTIDWLRTNTSPLPRADLYIVANIHRASEAFVNEICQRPFVFFLHDSTIERFYKQLLSSSKLNVFLSPRHREYVRRKFWRMSLRDSLLRRKNTLLQPSILDVDSLYVGEKEKGMVVYLGLIARHKGIDNILRYANQHPELTVFLYGKKERKDCTITARNVVHMGPCRPEDVPAILARAEQYIHLPKWVEAFGRGAMEGYLSGCNMICNKNVGCFSYPWPWHSREDVRDMLRHAAEHFWRQIEERL